MDISTNFLTDFEDTLEAYKEYLSRFPVWSRKIETNAFQLFHGLKELAFQTLPEDARQRIRSANENSDEEPSFRHCSAIIAELNQHIQALLTVQINHDERAATNKTLILTRGLCTALTHLRDKILAHNLRLVFKIIYTLNSNRKLAIPNSDMINEGSIGLMRAMDSFRPELGHKFSTYAYQWIEAYSRRAISNYRSLIKVPHYLSTIRTKVHGIIEEHKAIYREPPTLEYVSKSAKIPESKVEEILTIQDFTESLEAPCTTDSNLPLSEVITSQHDNHEGLIRDNFNQFYIKEAMKPLSDRQKTIISMRFGLDKYDALTRAVIANQMNLSQERIRQIEKESLEIIKLQLIDLGYADSVHDTS